MEDYIVKWNVIKNGYTTIVGGNEVFLAYLDEYLYITHIYIAFNPIETVVPDWIIDTYLSYMKRYKPGTWEFKTNENKEK